MVSEKQSDYVLVPSPEHAELVREQVEAAQRWLDGVEAE